MPTAYANLNADPHVTGSGTGSYQSTCENFPANIAFTATQKGFTEPWLGTLIITDASTGSTLASGTIFSAFSPGSNAIDFIGSEAFGCHPSNVDSVTIFASCGTSSAIFFSNAAPAKPTDVGSFTGSTHCGFPGNH